MKIIAIEEQIGKARALDSWFAASQGQALGQAFASEIQKISDIHQAGTILQLGLCGASPWLKQFNSKNIWLATPDKYNHQADIVSSYQNLPLDRRSVDLVIAPFLVELFNNHLEFLDEIDRVLKPMGQVILIGLNSFSLWSLAARLGFFSCFPGFKVHAHSPFFLSRSFIHKGYLQKSLESFWYLPPVSREKSIQRWGFLNQMGKMIAPFPAGFYCYIAQKYESSYSQPLLSPSIPNMPALLQPLGG